MAQHDFCVGAIAQNAATILSLAAQARAQQEADMVVFPELSVSGYPPDDLLLRPAYIQDCAHAVSHIAAQATGGIDIVLGWPAEVNGILYNAVSVLSRGQVACTVYKQQLPNYGVFDEQRYFCSSSQQAPALWQCKEVLIGLLICEDIWYPQPLSLCKQAGAELVVVINASPFAIHKLQQRMNVLQTQSKQHDIALAYLNAVGGHDGLVFDGRSLLSSADGHIHTPALCCAEQLLVADYSPMTSCWTPVVWPCDADTCDEAIIWRVIVRALRDYCTKNHFTQVWLAVSGGIDSALTLALAVDALGAQAVTAVRLPSQYTSTLSNNLATEQCEQLGVRVHTVPIQPVVEAAQAALAPVFHHAPADVTEENIQSRCRGLLMMALSNKLGGLLLTTGNKSEYAVGYATIYGDMCGGFAPLKDLYKTQVYALAAWRNAQPSAPVIPKEVITRAPSAELRPNQTDQDALPPYPELDALLNHIIEQRHSRAEIIAAGFAPETVDRIAHLLRTSEWKRQQSAPGPKISTCAFGRERRFPISNGYLQTDLFAQPVHTKHP